jgi:hypothetical protein
MAGKYPANFYHLILARFVITALCWRILSQQNNPAAKAGLLCYIRCLCLIIIPGSDIPYNIHKVSTDGRRS